MPRPGFRGTSSLAFWCVNGSTSRASRASTTHEGGFMGYSSSFSPAKPEAAKTWRLTAKPKPFVQVCGLNPRPLFLHSLATSIVCAMPPVNVASGWNTS